MTKYQSPVRVWMGPKLYVLIQDAKNADIVLRSKSCLEKPEEYETVRDVLGGDGLFTAKGEHWRVHRKLMQPSFKDSTIISNITVFNYYFRNFCKTTLADEVDGKAFDMLSPLNVCLLETYLHLTFGQEWIHKSKYSDMFQE